MLASELRGNFDANDLGDFRLPRVDCRRSKPRTSSIDTERSRSGISVVPATEFATDLGVVGSMISDGFLAVSAAGWREFSVVSAVLSDGGTWR